MKKRRYQLILSLLIKKQILIMMKISIDSKLSDLIEENEEDVALANFIESLKKKQTDEKIFSKK